MSRELGVQDEVLAQFQKAGKKRSAVNGYPRLYYRASQQREFQRVPD